MPVRSLINCIISSAAKRFAGVSDVPITRVLPIHPEEIEAKINNQLYVAECVVTERNHKLVALVFPDFETMKQDNINEVTLPVIMEENRKNANSELPKYEQISKIELVNEAFEKTPKRNIKRFKYV